MVGVGDEVAVREHHALRTPGRAARVEHRRQVILLHAGLGTEPSRVGGGEERLVPVGRPIVVANDVAGVGGEGAGIAVGEQDRGASVRQDRADFGRRQPGVERDDDHAAGGHGEERLDHAVAVEAEHGDAIAGLHTEPEQRADEPGTTVVQRCIVDTHVAADERRAVTGGAPRMVEWVGQREHGDRSNRTARESAKIGRSDPWPNLGSNVARRRRAR